MVTSSSWNAGGPWIDKADASKQLLTTSQVVKGPSKEKITIDVPETRRGEVKTYSLLTSVALPYTADKEIDYSTDKIIRLDEFTSGNKTINWEVPEGKWVVLSFFMCNTGQKLACPSPNSDGLIIDHLSKQATRDPF